MNHFKGNIHNIETFGTFDGPGIRYVLFLQGCPFQCKFCHNRDSWSTKTNSLMSVDDVLNDYSNYEAFYKKGGLTISGGEPLMQGEFVLALFKRAKALNIHTTLDTSAACFSERKKPLIKEILKYTDLVMLDLKHIDEAEHKALTNASNKHVLSFLDLLETLNQPTILRHVLIPTINDQASTIKRFKDYIQAFKCLEKVEVLPYHTNGKHKWNDLNLAYPLEGIPPMDKKKAKDVEMILNKSLHKNTYSYASKKDISIKTP